MLEFITYDTHEIQSILDNINNMLSGTLDYKIGYVSLINTNLNNIEIDVLSLYKKHSDLIYNIRVLEYNL